jgi:transcriptional regulator with XRE-family HTH domain
LVKTVSAAVTSRRVELGLSQTEVSKRSGVSQPTISDIEAGATPRNSTLAKIAVALDCLPTDLDPTYTPDGRNNKTRRRDAKPTQLRGDPEASRLLDGVANMMESDFGFVPSHVQVIQFLAKKAGFALPDANKRKTPQSSDLPSEARD